MDIPSAAYDTESDVSVLTIGKVGSFLLS